MAAALEQKKWRTSHTSGSLLDQEPDPQASDIIHDTARRSCASVSLACCSVTFCSPSDSAPSLRDAWNRTMLGGARPPLWGRPRRPRGASSRDKSLIKVANPSGHLPQKPTWGEFWGRCCCVRTGAAAHRHAAPAPQRQDARPSLLFANTTRICSSCRNGGRTTEPH